MSKDITESSERFGEVMGGFFYEILRAGGVQLHPTNAYERIRQVGDRTAQTIEHHAERKAVQVAEKLQKASVKAFKAIEEDIKKLQNENKKLNTELARLNNELSNIIIEKEK